MTDLEFQQANEISELKAEINMLRKALNESLEREKIADKIIAEKRKEIYDLRLKIAHIAS